MPDSAAASGYGVIPRDRAATMSGLELLQAWRGGQLPAPPIGRFMNGGLVEVAFGQVVFEGTPTEDHFNPMGIVHGGYAATLLDSCMGCAVHSTVAAGQTYTTIELKVNYVRPLTDRTGLVRAEGKVIAAGKRIATAEGRLMDRDGRLLAHGTTSCLIFAL